MITILILLILAQENGLVVPASCWWVFGAACVLVLIKAVVSTLGNSKK